MKIKTLIKPHATGASKTGEMNDCVVRAISNCTGVDYDAVHAVLKKNGRKDCKATYLSSSFPSLKELGLKFVGTFGRTRCSRNGEVLIKKHYNVFDGSRNDSITLGNLVKSLPYGKFVVYISGHALALVDGKIIDKGNNSAQKQVAMLFQFGEMTLPK